MGVLIQGLWLAEEIRLLHKHIIDIRNGLLKHITKTQIYVIVNFGVKP